MSDEHLSASDPREPADSIVPSEADSPSARSQPAAPPGAASSELSREYGGRKGLEPVRYGDWEKNGRCIDF